MKNSLFKNSMFKALLSICNIIIPLIIGPYVTHLLNVDLYGSFNRVISELNVFIVIGSFGVYNYGIKEISKIRNDKAKVNDMFTNLFVISLITNLIVCIIYLFYAFFTSSGIVLIIYLTSSVQFLANIFYMEFVNEALENYKFITEKTLIVRIIYLLCIFLFVKNENKISYEDKKYTSRLGVDVSVFQGDIDWEQVKATGYEFAILRIGYRGYGEEGTLNADEKFEQNLENARKAGIDVGVYFFSQAINEEEAKEEADFVLEHLKGQELQMPVVYDPEHILEDKARTDGVTGEQFTQNAKVFCKEIEEAGYDAMIYSNMLWEAYELDLEKLLDYPVWYADYEELPQTPYRFSMWQYRKRAGD